MTLPASGMISLGQVNTELGRSATALIGMDETAVRNLAGVGGSGTNWGMDSLHGKSSYTPMTVTGVDDSRSYSSATSGGTAYAYPSVTVSGGSGGYTYTWTMTSNPGGATLTNATSSQCTLSHTYTKLAAGSFTVVLQCVVQDNTSHSVTKTGINASADWS